VRSSITGSRCCGPSAGSPGASWPTRSACTRRSLLERGEYSPSLHLALRIAAHFEVPAEVIFSTEPFPRLTIFNCGGYGSGSSGSAAVCQMSVQITERSQP
jgi:DNA-binding XRE family transcriptional regulator